MGFLMKTLLITILNIFFALISLGNKDLKLFCIKNNITPGSALIALHSGDCLSCFASIDKIIEDVKSVKKDIKIFVVTDNLFSPFEKTLFAKRIKVDTNDIKIFSDEKIVSILTKKTDGIPSISLISSKLTVKKQIDLKQGDLDQFLATLNNNQISKALPQLYLTSIQTIKDSLGLSVIQAQGVIELKHAYFLLNSKYRILSKYNKNGNCLNHFFIDSLKLNYFSLIKEHLNPKDYESTIRIIKEEKINDIGQLINYEAIFKTDTSLTIGVSLSVYKDGTYKGISAVMASEKEILIKIDENFKLLSVLDIEKDSSEVISFINNGAYSEGIYYLPFFKKTDKNWYIGCFKEHDSKLQLNRTILLPDKKLNRNIFYLSHNISDDKHLFLVYVENNLKFSYLCDVNIQNASIQYIWKVKNQFISGHYITKTPKSNYICLVNKNGKIQIGVYHTSEKKFYPAIENKLIENTTKQTDATFLFDQKIFNYQLVE